MKCKVGWIDCRGVPTYDDREAVGMAVLHRDGERFEAPICAEHLKYMGQTHSGECKHVRGTADWRFEPFKKE